MLLALVFVFRGCRCLIPSLAMLPMTVLFAQEVTPDRLNQAENEPHNWLTYGGTYRAWRYSTLNQINTSNVGRLIPAWAFQLGDVEGGLQCTPLVADGVMYVVGPNSRVFALDAATGKTLWSYFHKYPRSQKWGYGHYSRGLALGHGNVYLGSLDNYVVALDAKTGAEVWKANVEDSKKYGCNITGAPLVVKDMVIVGSTGGDSAHRGHIVAYEGKTGLLRWRFNTIPEPGERGNETWTGDSWKFGGGAAWLTGSYDPELNLLYWGIGNPAADFDGELRKGVNLYTDCVLALNPDRGEIVWHYQEIPHDLWDFDSAYECILVDIPVNGKMRKLLIHPNKGGYIWVLDRTNGEFVSGWKFIDSLNWSSGLDEKGVPVGRREPVIGTPIFICPSIAGARSWNHASFSPRTGLLYNIGVEWCTELLAQKQVMREGEFWMAGTFPTKPRGRAARCGPFAFRPFTATGVLSRPMTTGGRLEFDGLPSCVPSLLAQRWCTVPVARPP